MYLKVSLFYETIIPKKIDVVRSWGYGKNKKREIMDLLYKEVLKGSFVDRPNRFVIHVNLDGNIVLAHLPNPGRMWELLFSGVTIYIVHNPKEGAKTQYRVIGIERDGIPIMLDTNYSNDVAEYLIKNQLIKGWEEWSVVRREYTMVHDGIRSRFDLLLRNSQGEDFMLEVKSCTLFSKKGAMFPDAITERGRKHLLHLKALQEEGFRTGVLFLVQWERAEWFLPDYHTDLEFANTFKEVAPSLDWKAVSLKWNNTFTWPTVVRQCTYAESVVDREAKDEGDYCVVLYLDRDVSIEVGSKGIINFQKGYYVYIGSAKVNLSKRLDRHRRKRKQKHWHLDYLRGYCEIIATLPIRTQDDLECVIAKAIKDISDWSVRQFGSSDCNCDTHLYGFNENPIHYELFMMVIEDMRMNRLDEMMR